MTHDRGERWVPWIFGLLAALPVLIAPYPPMTDFPHHESLVGMLRLYKDATRFPPGMYELNLGEPNQLFHLLAWPITYVLPLTLSCRIVTGVSVLAVPVGAARLARHLGASRFLALALVPVALGWLFSWGFINNLLGLGLFLGFLPELDRFAAKPTWKRFAVVAAGTVLLYFAHELLMLLFAATALLFAAVYPLRLRDTIARTTPAVVAGAMAATQIVYQEHLKTATVRAIGNSFAPLGRRLATLPSTLVGFNHPFETWTVFGSCVAVAGVFAVVAHAARRRTSAPHDGESSVSRIRRVLQEQRFLLLALASAALYLVLPTAFNGASLVSQRFIAPAFAIGALAAASGSAGRASFVPKLLAAALPLEALFLLWPSFVESSRAHEQFLVIANQIPLKSSVAAIDLELDQSGRTFTVASQLSSVLPLRGGRVLYSFTDSTVAPVRVATQYQWGEPAARIMVDPYALRPAYDLTRFEYLIVHSVDPNRLQIAAIAMAPDAKLVDIRGEWALLRSTLDVVPMTAPDAPLPTPRAATLRKRIREVVLSLQHSQSASTSGEGAR